jgi:IclR family transcriptional regulator, acetate operon repressor
MNDVKSARRVLEILRFFAEEKAPAPLARVATALGLPKSSCLGLLETLVTEGYAYQTDGRYYLTARWFRESELVARHDRIAPRCRPGLQRVGEQLGETVILAQLSQKKVVYLDVIEAAHVLRFSAFIGQRKPIHASASGRALLGALPAAEADRIAQGLDYTRFTSTTVRTPGVLLKEVQAGQKRGWHLNIGEHQEGTVSIAVAFVLDGAPLALVVGAPRSRAEGARADALGKALKQAASAMGESPASASNR